MSTEADPFLAEHIHEALSRDERVNAPELHVTANTPPTFLVQAEDDPVHVENSLFYYLALKDAKVPAEMHLYSIGGHGYGLRKTDKPITGWPHEAEKWMRSLDLLQAH